MTSISGRRSQSSMRSGTSSDFYEPPTAQEIMEHGRYLGLDPGESLAFSSDAVLLSFS